MSKPIETIKLSLVAAFKKVAEKAEIDLNDKDLEEVFECKEFLKEQGIDIDLNDLWKRIKKI